MLYKPDPKPGEKDRKFYVETLRGTECLACEGRKQTGFAFCYKCYYRLPEELRFALYRKIGNGFETAFEAAYRWLQDESNQPGHRRYGDIP